MARYTSAQKQMTRSMWISWSLAFTGLGCLVMTIRTPAQPPVPQVAKKPVSAMSPGEKVFRQQCAGCHGEKGKGGPGFNKPLVGSRSVAELATFISKQMPPGPKKCTVPDAQTVASYMYAEFYSPVAQERNRPARVEIARLTVRQFRNAVADLVSDYNAALPNSTSHGLRAEYFKSRDFNGKDRVTAKVDPEVAFDFKSDGPEPGKYDPHTFSVMWQGSVLAPDTGDYEFIVKSDQAIRLFVNGEKPVIDAWVKSGSDTEFKTTVTLLGGRAYPIRLDFSKATQGVDDTEKNKGKPAPPAFIRLEWRRPKRVAEVIPSRLLFPDSIAPTFVPTTSFPADDRSIGYERGTSVSKEWDDATTAAALETAGYLAENLLRITGIQDDAKDRKERLVAYCKRFVERAFRRPLTPEIANLYVDKQFLAAANLETAVKRVVILTLKSPRFLYREVVTNAADPYAIAAHLSFGLWDTLPDAALAQAAASGQLKDPEQITAQAERLANDPRAWNKLRDFLLLWLKVDESPDLVKNPKSFPGFDATVAGDLRTSLELFLENTAGSPAADYRAMMLSPQAYLNGRLSKIYGANLPENADFQPVTLDGEDRAGVITSPYLLARFAYLDGTSPIHRGVLVIRNLLGRTLMPPPAAFAPLAASLHPDLTTRQRVSLQTKPAMCNACHGLINPLGFTLERFDAIGRLRQKDNGKPVDASGYYTDRSGVTVKFSGAKDLARYLADSDDAQSAFTEKLFQNMIKQPILAYGPSTLSKLRLAFAQNRYSIRKLMVAIVTETAGQTGNRQVGTKGAKP